MRPAPTVAPHIRLAEVEVVASKGKRCFSRGDKDLAVDS